MILSSSQTNVRPAAHRVRNAVFQCNPRSGSSLSGKLDDGQLRQTESRRDEVVRVGHPGRCPSQLTSQGQQLAPVGSLDAETRRNFAAVGAESTARKELAFYLDAPGDRNWWRLANTPDGQLAGLAIPSATPYGPNIGYLGVLPELRGNGYVDDILAEVTRAHAEHGATGITATTDLGNAPMAAAFGRAGYRNVQARIVLSPPTMPDADQ